MNEKSYLEMEYEVYCRSRDRSRTRMERMQKRLYRLKWAAMLLFFALVTAVILLLETPSAAADAKADTNSAIQAMTISLIAGTEAQS